MVTSVFVLLWSPMLSSSLYLYCCQVLNFLHLCTFILSSPMLSSPLYFHVQSYGIFTSVLVLLSNPMLSSPLYFYYCPILCFLHLCTCIDFQSYSIFTSVLILLSNPVLILLSNPMLSSPLHSHVQSKTDESQAARQEPPTPSSPVGVRITGLEAN